MLHVRRAEPDDIPDVLSLVAAMFADLGTPHIHESWADDATQALTLHHDKVGAFLVLDADRPLATAVGLIEQRLPSPRRPSGRIGYVEWLATNASDRRRGAARVAMQALMNWFTDNDIHVVDVHASAHSAPLYRGLGFTETTSTPLRRVM